MKQIKEIFDKYNLLINERISNEVNLSDKALRQIQDIKATAFISMLNEIKKVL